MQVDWTDCPETEVIAGKVSGEPILVGTRIPADAITTNYESSLHEGLTPEEALAETAENYPGAGLQRIKKLLDYFYSHQPINQL